MIDREASKLATGNWRLPTDFPAGQLHIRTALESRPHISLPANFERRKSFGLSRLFRICMGLIPALLWGLLLFGAQGNKDADLVREIEDNLIAPCCWSQPVSQHYSEAAEQIRTEVRAMVAEGMTRDEILDHYVAIYGERILATPRAKGFNMLAYVLPWAALAFGAWLLIVLVKKLRSPAPSPGPVDVPYERYASRIEKELKEFEE